MNQRKLEVVKQEMARVNSNIVGISELKWTGMGEFNSDDHYLLLRAEIPQKKRSSHHGQQKNLKCLTWMQPQKQHNDLCSFPRQTITVIQVYAPTSNAEEAEVERFYEDLQELLELKPPQNMPFSL